MARSSGSLGSNGAVQTSPKTQWLTYIAFDIVYLDGPAAADLIKKHFPPVSQGCPPVSISSHSTGDISSLPLSARRAILQDIITTRPNRLEMVRYKEVISADKKTRLAQLEAYFENMVENREEGLVVKDLTSPYLIGDKSRSGTAVLAQY